MPITLTNTFQGPFKFVENVFNLLIVTVVKFQNATDTSQNIHLILTHILTDKHIVLASLQKGKCVTLISIGESPFFSGENFLDSFSHPFKPPAEYVELGPFFKVEK